MPEAYTQCFCGLEKALNQKSTLDRWHAACKDDNLATLQQAAMLADEYRLTHKNYFFTVTPPLNWVKSITHYGVLLYQALRLTGHVSSGENLIIWLLIEWKHKLPPAHKAPPLRKCRGFCERSVDDHKKFLKEHFICFYCCSSTEHLAKNCTTKIKCTKCDSTAHVTILHSSTLEDGWEEDKADNQEVKSMSKSMQGRFEYESMCFDVRVFPNRRKEKSKKMYTILDKQTNHFIKQTLYIYDIFKISRWSYSHMLKTAGRKASGFTVEPVDKKLSNPLPTLLECI